MRPRFVFPSPWAHDRIFHLVSGFPFQITWLPVAWVHDPFLPLVSGFLNHVTSGCMSPRSLFTPWSAVVTSGEPTIPFYPLVSGFHFRSWRHPYIKTRQSGPYGPTLLLALYTTSAIWSTLVFILILKQLFIDHSWIDLCTGVFCTAPQMIPRPQMIPDRKWSPNWTANDPRTTNDPHSGPQMIPLKRLGKAWSLSEGENTGMWTSWPKKKQKNFLLISEIQHFKGPRIQWPQGKHDYG